MIFVLTVKKANVIHMLLTPMTIISSEIKVPKSDYGVKDYFMGQ